mmetsp:Transcript_15587/g.48960  ORF Transcript_15587/g.48960 Transcript_15587/m.48960 type:complete len:204 (-) Transcript_15587:30-641(-)
MFVAKCLISSHRNVSSRHHLTCREESLGVPASGRGCFRQGPPLGPSDGGQHGHELPLDPRPRARVALQEDEVVGDRSYHPRRLVAPAINRVREAKVDGGAPDLPPPRRESREGLDHLRRPRVRMQVDARGEPRRVAQHLIELPVGAYAVQAGGPPQLRRQVQLRGEDAPLRVDLVELAARGHPVLVEPELPHHRQWVSLEHRA